MEAIVSEHLARQLSDMCKFLNCYKDTLVSKTLTDVEFHTLYTTVCNYNDIVAKRIDFNKQISENL